MIVQSYADGHYGCYCVLDCLKFIPRTYNSELFALLAFGLISFTKLKYCLTSSTKSWSMSPWKTLTKKLPIGLRTEVAIRKDCLARSIWRAWSSSQTPEILGETSEIMTSAERGKSSLILWVVFESVTSPVAVRTLGRSMGSTRLMSTPRTNPELPTILLEA